MWKEHLQILKKKQKTFWTGDIYVVQIYYLLWPISLLHTSLGGLSASAMWMLERSELELAAEVTHGLAF